jgi:hypothetical protein
VRVLDPSRLSNVVERRTSPSLRLRSWHGGRAGKSGVASDTDTSPQFRKIAFLMIRNLFGEKLLCEVFAD